MLRVVRSLWCKLDALRYRRSVERALVLHLRGEARRDGLKPRSFTTALDIEWRARDIHPWDQPLLSAPEKATAFVTQTLADTEAAIDRLFDALPQVDVIRLRVLDKTSETVIISGTVLRPAISIREEQLSIGMRLKYLGLTYHSAGSLFEPVEPQECPETPVVANSAFLTGQPLPAAMYRHDLNGS